MSTRILLVAVILAFPGSSALVQSGPICAQDDGKKDGKKDRKDPGKEVSPTAKEQPPTEREAAAALRALGARVIEADGHVVEVSLNNNKRVRDGDLPKPKQKLGAFNLWARSDLDQSDEERDGAGA